MRRQTAFAVATWLLCALAALGPSPSAALAQDDLTPLFATPTRAELDAVAADWASRDVAPGQYTVERTGAGNGFALAEVRHEIDGLTHYGVVRYPHHFQSGGRFPVLVLLHGGFDGLDLDWLLTFDETFPTPTLADSFLVIAPTFRGEMLNGYGILPTHFSDGDPSPFDHDCDDTIALLTAVLSHETAADASRVVAFGGSRGGNVAYHLAQRDHRVLRTVIRYGPADFRLDHVQAGTREMAATGATADRLGELVYEFIAGPYLAGAITLEKARRTLLSWCATPHLRGDLSLQIHHGVLDDVVPISHSREVDAWMTMFGAGEPAYAYYEYPQGGHVPTSLDGHEARAEAYLLAALTTTGAPALPPAPLRLSAAPNPFAGSVALRVASPDGADKRLGVGSRLTIFDARGRRVRDLALAAPSAGEAAAGWDGRDVAGRQVPAGIYFAAVAERPEIAPLRITRLR